MKVLIIEDERIAAERLKKMVLDLYPSYQIVGMLVSVKSSVEWLKSNPAPNVILMDINLADGQSFEIFSQIEVKTPVIFTTAYDEHALKAFKVSSIDYLLKPIKLDDLKRAFSKLKSFNEENSRHIESMLKKFSAHSKDFQKRIVIRYGDTIKMVEVGDVAYFYTEDKINYLCTRDDLRYPVDHNLDELDHMLDPAVFFRINRQFIVNIHAIDKMLAWSKSRVKVILRPPSKEDTIVSTERSPHFKTWLVGNV
jgi:DNA-binding LytR/AlgR family response regulator